MSGCTCTFAPVCLCLCVSAWEGVLLRVCVDMSTPMTEGCVHMSHGGRSCVGVSVGPCRLIQQGLGRVDTHVSEGTGEGTHACVHVCLDTGNGCDGWRSRWPLLVCDVHGCSSESPAQVWASISSHLHHGQEGGGRGVMKDETLGPWTGKRPPTPFPGGNSQQLLPFLLPCPLLLSSPSSLFSGAEPRLSSRPKGVGTGRGQTQTLPWP